MKSMTGYGRGESAREGLKATVEISSVNRKQSEISVYLPRTLEALESKVRDEINKQIARGKVTARIAISEADSSGAAGVHLNRSLAAAYSKELRKLARELAIQSDITIDTILRCPGVLSTADDLADCEAAWPMVEKALKPALAALVAMRSKEGEHLKKDLISRFRLVEKCLAKIEKEAPKASIRYRDQLRERIAKAGLEKPDLEDDRLTKEVVYFADRSDITEEITRLRSHIKQADQAFNQAEPVGRTLDFLTQEMNRETNTIGSKANDRFISTEVVKIKTELEKIREQIQNVE